MLKTTHIVLNRLKLASIQRIMCLKQFTPYLGTQQRILSL